MYTILYTILTPSNGIVWYCKTPMEKAKSLVFCKMAFRGIVLYQGFDFLSLRLITPVSHDLQGLTFCLNKESRILNPIHQESW